MTSFYPVQFFAEDEPAPFNFEEQPAQPVQPVQLNASSQELLAYLTGMESLLPLFHRDEILDAFISSGRSGFNQGAADLTGVSKSPKGKPSNAVRDIRTVEH